MSSYEAPSYCGSCGEPLPWTQRRLDAAAELAAEAADLTADERAQFEESLVAISSDTPQTQLAAVRVKKVLAKAGNVAGGALRDILVDIASETAKKILWPSP